MSPLGKPRCFWDEQWLICLNKKKLEMHETSFRHSDIKIIFPRWEGGGGVGSEPPTPPVDPPLIYLPDFREL